MDTGYLILIAVFFAGAGFLLRKNEQRKESIVIWLYLLGGGLALYSVESANIDQPIHLTALVALVLCLIPTIIDGLLSLNNSTPTLKRKNLLSTSENYGSGQ
jgi:hypothetical protein